MGRGSSSSRNSSESAAVAGVSSAMKKKAGTWDAPKSGGLLPLTLQDELTNLELLVKKRMNVHIIQAEQEIDKVKGLITAAQISLTRDVQNMNIRDYVQRFGGNLSTFAAHEQRRVQSFTNRAAEAATKRRSARKKISEMASRSHSKHANLSANSASMLNTTSAPVPSTPAHGTALSATSNLLTVQAKKTPGGSLSQGTPVVTLHVGDNELEITEATVASLDPSTAQTTQRQLEKLFAQLNKAQALLKQNLFQ